MDACKKCAIVFDNAVAALEVIGSESIQAQVTGKVPIVNGESLKVERNFNLLLVDKTDGFQLLDRPELDLAQRKSEFENRLAEKNVEVEHFDERLREKSEKLSQEGSSKIIYTIISTSV